MKLSDYVFEFVASQGVKHVFLVPGGGAMHLNNSLGSRSDITFVCTAHEQASAIAAEAYARVTNNLGVALVTTGPGGTNAVTGVDAAWLDSTPCLFISGQVKRADLKKDSGLRQLGVQETDIVSIVSSITKYAVTVTDPKTIRYHLERAVYEARSGRPGPVWIDIPLDVQAADVDVSTLEGWTPPSAAVGNQTAVEEAVSKTLALLSGAQRPVILVGNGVRLAGAQEDFLRLADQLGMPVLTTRLGVDLIPASHPLSFGMPGTIASRASNFCLQNSDFLLMLGARMDMALIAYAPERLARAAKKVMVNIDAAEIHKLGKAIDVAAALDARAFVRGLSARVGELSKADRSAWLLRCRDWKARYPFVTPKHSESEGAVSVYAFSDALAGALEEGAVVLPGSAGNACEVFLTAFKAKAGQRIFHNKGTGAMGLSQPSAIGAALASGRPTVCIDGDGGFALNVQELQTIRRLGLPIVFFVMNNGGYASIRASQQGYFGRLTGADAKSGMTLPALDKLAAAYGLGFARLCDMRNLRADIERILALPRPLLCEVVVIPDEPRAPRVSSMQKPDGSMVSKPLEDMWPFLEREEFVANMIVKPLDE
ncbi:MAG TPA: thiamine pyrophosphate-binding protein [Myxococcales bacterium]|jgi:acetolactate synthase-1/2/3 large subunit